MTVWNIAWKDLRRSVRSAFLLVFALGLPLLTAGVFYAAFRGLSGGDDAAIAAPRVTVANMDPGGEAAGILAGLLTGGDLAGILDAQSVGDPAAARAAVDAGEAAAAVIIPAGFSANVAGAGGDASVEVYQDPALTVGPAIVRSIVRQVLDGMAGGWVAVTVSGKALAEHGVPADGQNLARIGAGYTAWAQQALAGGTGSAFWDVTSAAGAKEENRDFISQILSTIMAMMLVFYCFFTGTASAQSILKEQEDGTLPRLFTTPVRRSEIIGGKLLAVFLTLLIQVVVLLVVSAAVFGIRWGGAASVVLAALGTAVMSASFAVFLTSFLRDTKQAGMVYGVVVNLIGWIGISRLFAGIIPGMERYSGFTDIVSLISPQGWAARIWQESMAGNPVGITLAGMLLLSLVMFGIGVFKFNRRFAN
jgi:ABC-2 type transport system permease protein